MVAREFGDSFFIKFSMAQRIQVVLQIKDFDLFCQRIANRPVHERFVTFRLPAGDMIDGEKNCFGETFLAKFGESPITILDNIMKDGYHFFLGSADFEHEPQRVEDIWRA